PNLQLVLISLFFRVFGDTLFAYRFVNTVMGTLTLLGTYLLFRLLFGRRIATLTLALGVLFHWNLHFSRIGTVYMQGAAATVWGLYFVAKGLETGSLTSFGLAGLVTGLGFQSYWCARILPPLFAVWLVVRCAGMSSGRRALALR